MSYLPSPTPYDRGRRTSYQTPSLAGMRAYQPERGPAEGLPRLVMNKVILRGVRGMGVVSPAQLQGDSNLQPLQLDEPHNFVRIAYAGGMPIPGATGTTGPQSSAPSAPPPPNWNPNAPVGYAPAGSGPAAIYAGDQAAREQEWAAFRNFEQQQADAAAIAENASVLATNPSNLPPSPAPSIITPTSTVAAPAASDSFTSFTNWLGENTLIASVPNWVPALAITAVLLTLYGKSQGRR